jgi:hypothetical protein
MNLRDDPHAEQGSPFTRFVDEPQERFVVDHVDERVSINFGGTFEMALWCKLLRDRGATGHQVACVLGRSEGYVNNLIRILERASVNILLRWRAEQLPGTQLPPVCATDWLMQVCVLPHVAHTRSSHAACRG